MSFLSDVGGFFEDVGGAAWDVVETVGDIAGYAAPVVSAINPGIGAAFAGVAIATNAVESAVDKPDVQRARGTLGSQSKGEAIQSFGENQVLDQRRDGACGSEGGGEAEGKGFFRQLAFLLGSSMDETASQLIDKSKELRAAADSEDSSFFEISADVQALGQQLKVEGDTLSNVIKTAGDAADALVRKN
jgi:hypothetical protein